MMKIKWGLLFLGLLMMANCEQEDPSNMKQDQDPIENATTVKDSAYQQMRVFYLWNDKIPEVNPGDYRSPQHLFNAILYDSLDRYSAVVDASQFKQLFEEGKYEGFGFEAAWDSEDKLRVALVYPGSPFGKEGITRGWEFIAINGTSISENFSPEDGRISGKLEAGKSADFKLVNNQQDTVSKNITSAVFDIKTVVHREVMDVDGKKVGYMVYNDFVGSSLSEIESAFQNFNEGGISELVLDLRYNGGGASNVAVNLASAIIGNQGSGNVFYKRTTNDLINQDTTVHFEQVDYQLDLDRLFVITTGNTASSSELVINGLEPYMDVLQIGDDTYGKPVGSTLFEYSDFAILPVVFKSVNSNDYGEYFQGLAPEVYTPDDVTKPFGNPEEASLQQAVYYIKNGQFSEPVARKLPPEKRTRLVTPPGLRSQVGAF